MSRDTHKPECPNSSVSIWCLFVCTWKAGGMRRVKQGQRSSSMSVIWELWGMGPFHYWCEDKVQFMFWKNCLVDTSRLSSLIPGIHIYFLWLHCFLGENPMSSSLSLWNSDNVDSVVDSWFRNQYLTLWGRMRCFSGLIGKAFFFLHWTWLRGFKVWSC